ncbi:MAG: chitobiase/beta-hexosaminidase C-terminal domain-containing protein, partial [Rubrobacteraceae bacterium]
MTANYEVSPEKGRRRLKKLLAASAAALVVSAGLAATSWALPTGPGIRDGKNITVAHNIDFVAVFGYTVGDPMTVEVFRNGVKIGTAGGPAQNTAEGGGLEVNHGPAGAPQPGDCWENITPDIIPGDRIVVTGDGGTDEVLVDDILITDDPIDATDTADTSDVYVEGHASFADGTPIPVDQLNSGEIRVGSRFRAGPNEVVRTPGTTDGFRAIYKEPYNIERNRDNVDPKQAILNGDHAMGYGHVAPLPPESQFVEGVGNANGPALGCEGSPQEANAVVTADDEAVNLTSGDLVLGGTAQSDATAVTGTVSDGSGGSVPFDATGSLSTNAGEKSWTATIPRADLEQLADGTLTVAGQYTVGGTDIGGRELQILKDTVAPAKPTATPGGGRYDRLQRVTLSAENGASIHYTVNGSRPTLDSRTFNRTIPVTATQTIRALVVDRAGNPSQVAAHRYTILKNSFVSINRR